MPSGEAESRGIVFSFGFPFSESDREAQPARGYRRQQCPETKRLPRVVLLSNKAGASMPTYYFHIDNGTFVPASEGVDLPDLDAVRREAVRAAGEIINDSKQSFWEHRGPWIMHVTDYENQLLFTLEFVAKVPSGKALYIPQRGAEGGYGRRNRSQRNDPQCRAALQMMQGQDRGASPARRADERGAGDRPLRPNAAR
jgi:hypothetical protein